MHCNLIRRKLGFPDYEGQAENSQNMMKSAIITATAISAATAVSASARWNGSPKLTREKIPEGHLRGE